MFEKLKSGCRTAANWCRSKAKYTAGAIAAVGGAVVMAATSAHAALTTDQQAAVDSIQNLISDLSSAAWSITLAVSGVLIGIGLYKKFFHKAT